MCQICQRSSRVRGLVTFIQTYPGYNRMTQEEVCQAVMQVAEQKTNDVLEQPMDLLSTIPAHRLSG